MGQGQKGRGGASGERGGRALFHPGRCFVNGFQLRPLSSSMHIYAPRILPYDFCGKHALIIAMSGQKDSKGYVFQDHFGGCIILFRLS